MLGGRATTLATTKGTPWLARGLREYERGHRRASLGQVARCRSERTAVRCARGCCSAGFPHAPDLTAAWRDSSSLQKSDSMLLICGQQRTSSISLTPV